MAIHLEPSSYGYGPSEAFLPEWPEIEPPAPAPAADPPPSTEAEPSPSTWVQNLPSPDFGPQAPGQGTPPGPNALDDLPPPAVLSTTDAGLTAPAPPHPATAVAPTATPAEIATLELFLADPLNRELVQAHGGTLPVLDNGEVTQAQVARYGADLTARLSQLDQATSAVRDLYLQAMDEAARNLGPDTPGAVFVPGGPGDGPGDVVPGSWRFDPAAFTQAYAQAGLREDAPLAQRAFAAMYGPDALQAWERRLGGGRGSDNTLRGYTLAGSFELSAPAPTDLDGHPNRESLGLSPASLNPDSHELRPLSLHAPPELHDPQAVWFDARLGWVTHGDNVVVRPDLMDKAIPVVAAIAAAWAVGPYAAQLGASAGAATGSTFAAGAVKAGVMAAAGSAASQIAGTGSLDFGQLLQTTLSGALTGGLVQGLDIAPNLSSTSFSTRVMAMTAQSTVQGAVQELMGGRFRDGFTSGMASGLAAEITQALGDSLGKANLSPMQQSMATMLTRATGSAIRALASGDDVEEAMALEFLGGLVGSGLDEAQTWAGTRDESSAETARLARQNEGLAAAAAANPAQIARDAAWAAQNDAILARRGQGDDQSTIDETASTQASGAAGSSPTDGTGPAGPGSPGTQTVVITGLRPPGTAVDVTLPPGIADLEDLEDITRAGARTQLLMGDAATGALASLGVVAAGAPSGGPAGRVLLYAGERVIGYVIPHVGLVLGVGTAAYYMIHSGTQSAPGDAFVNVDGLVQRYAPTGDGALVLQTHQPQRYDLPISPEEDQAWVTVGRVVALSDAERDRYLRPTTTPAQPQGPSSLPPLPADPDRFEPLPGYEAEARQPVVIGTPAAAQPSWQDLIIEASNSEELGRNLRAAGSYPPLDVHGNELAGYRPHHMLPSAKWSDLDPLRAKFAAWNIDLNSAENGVWLPSSGSPTDAPGSYHDRLHNTEYKEAFGDAFVGTTTREQP